MKIPIADLKRFIRFATALFGHSLIKRPTMINIYAEDNLCTLTATNRDSQIQLKIPCRPEWCSLQEPVTLAPEALDHICKGEGDVTVLEGASTENSSRYSVSLQHGVVRRVIELDHTSPPLLVENDSELTQAGDNLLEAHQQTVQVTDDSSVRYALYSVQLEDVTGLSL